MKAKKGAKKTTRNRSTAVTCYKPDGDRIDAVFGLCSHYAEFISPGLTIYRSKETKEVIGMQISGLRELGDARDLERLAIEVWGSHEGKEI